MSADEIRNLIFQKLYEEWVEGKDEPVAFVGMDGNGLISVLQAGGEHSGIQVIPAEIRTAGS